MSNRSLATGSIAVMVGMILRQLGIVALFSILTRVLDRGVYGQFQQSWMIGLAVCSIMTLGIPQSMLYFIPRMYSKLARRRAFVQSILLLELGGLAGGLIIFFFARPLSYVFCGDYSLVPILKVYWPVVPFLGFWTRVNSIFNSIERPKLAGVMSGLYGLLLLVSMGGATIFTRELKGLFASQAIALGVFMLAGAFVGWAVIRQRTDDRSPEQLPPQDTSSSERLSLSSQFIYAFPLIATFLVAAVGRLIDKALVSNRFSAEDFALYANGAIEIPIGAILVGAVYGVILPRFSRQFAEGKTGEAVSLNHLAVRNIAMFVFPSAIFLAVFSTTLMVVLFGQEFTFSGRVFMLYAIGMLTVIYSPYSIINATGKTRLSFFLSIAAICTNFTLSWLGLMLFGMIGPAIGTVTFKLVIHTLFALVAARAVGTTFRRFLPWRAMGKTLAVALTAVVPASFALLIPAHPLVRLICGACVYAPVYFLIARKVGIIEQAHLEIVRGFLVRGRPD